MDPTMYLGIRRGFNKLRAEAPAPSRLIFDEFAMLCTLHDHKGLSATQIAAIQGITCPTMTHRAGHLTELGYISRSANADDKRKLRISLTRRGTNYVHKTAAAIVEMSPEGSQIAEMGTSGLVPVVARMGTFPMSADNLVLLSFATTGADAMQVMRIVETTALLQPTASMAVLRLESSGCIESPGISPGCARRPMRRGSGCVLTPEGALAAEEVVQMVEEL